MGTVIKEFLGASDQVVVTPQDVSYIVKTDVSDAFEVRMTMKKNVIGTFDSTGVTLQFIDGAGGDDTLTRDKGSWICEDFDVGMVLDISSTTSNDSTTYAITAITDTTLTFATATVTAESDATGAVITGAIPSTDWIVYETIAAGDDKFTFIEGSGTGLWFFRTAGAGTSNIWVQS